MSILSLTDAGIGRPSGQMEVASYVLQPFKKTEMAEMDSAIAETLQIINSILALGMDKALSGSRV
jgi:peptidyl-tRNA hydrolase